MNRTIHFHTGFYEIQNPDIYIGRKNADFGQGFYLSDNENFSKRWARTRKDKTAYLNKYELITDDLKIKQLNKDLEWSEYIYSNRNGLKDCLSEYDVIIGPIANDTIYDTFGIITSGLLKKEDVLRLLLIGPSYMQTVIKTEKAVSQLRFISSEVLCEETVKAFRKTVEKEEKEYQVLFANALKEISDVEQEDIL